MIKPGVHAVTGDEMAAIEASGELDGAYVAEFDGASIRTLNEWLAAAYREFKMPDERWEGFPDPDRCWYPYDAFDDWMCDLTWLDDEDDVPIAVIFRDYAKLMRDEPGEREFVVERFRDEYIPGWAEGMKSFYLWCYKPELKHDIALYLVD